MTHGICASQPLSGQGLAICRSIRRLASCQSPGVHDQQAAIFRRAGTIKANQGQFIALQRSRFAGDEISQRRIKHFGNSFHIVANLSGTVGFPLRDSGTGNTQFGGKFVLGEVGGEPKGSNTSTNGFWGWLFLS
jgi:hypothetical protein